MMRPTATYKNVDIPVAKWTDSADLAMVRDWFYPDRAKTRSKTRSNAPQANFDPYAPVILDTEDDIEEDGDVAQSHATGKSNPPTSSTRSKTNRQKRKAVQRVDIYSWHDRDTPHAILATAALVDAQLHYEEGYMPASSMRGLSTRQQKLYNNQTRSRRGSDENNKTRNWPGLDITDTLIHGLDDDNDEDQTEGGFKISTGVMKSIFAMAFSRFVNGFVDRDVARSSKAMRNTGLNIPHNSTTSASISTTKTKPGQKKRSKARQHDRLHQQGNNSNNDSKSNGDSDSDSNSNSDSDDVDNAGRSQPIPKGSGESSMYKHASTIGMPMSFVDMRHRVTHGRELPRLEELSSITEEALSWLWERWWKINVKADSELRNWQMQQWDEAIGTHARAQVQAQAYAQAYAQVSLNPDLNRSSIRGLGDGDLEVVDNNTDMHVERQAVEMMDTTSKGHMIWESDVKDGVTSFVQTWTEGIAKPAE